jgi:hypothetical protein
MVLFAKEAAYPCSRFLFKQAPGWLITYKNSYFLLLTFASI